MLKNSPKTIYTCTKCDAQTPKWSGRCFECGAWSTLKKDIVDNSQKATSQKTQAQTPAAKIINLSEVQTKNYERINTHLTEINRVLGGGIVPGSLILLSGEPGIGKSTILAQIADKINTSVIYASGEESAHQVKDRLVRLNCNLDQISFISETNIEKVISAITKHSPKLAIIDSIQTFYSSQVDSEISSITQIKAITAKLLEFAKTSNTPIILIGHITKDGSIAGPKNMEHMVDVVLYFEADKTNNYRSIRANKNRFGSIDEIGIFEMTSNGFKEITNPSLLFLDQDKNPEPGTITSSILDGNRPLLIEVQALTSKTTFGYPQRKAAGFDLNRLQILTAVLMKKARLNLANQDIFLNVAGGFKINDTQLDLAVCLSITSSLLNLSLPARTICIGEVGLSGDIRPVPKIETHIKNAINLGYQNIICANNKKSSEINIRQVANIMSLSNLFKVKIEQNTKIHNAN